MTQASLSSPAFSAPEIKATALAMEKSINARGGIGGRPLKVIVCDNKLAPTGSSSCARRAVKEGVVATIGGLNNNPEQSYPIYKQKGIPVFLGADLGAEDYTNRLSYPSAANVAGYLVGKGVLAAQQGCKRPSVIAPEAFASLFPLISAGYAAAGGTGKVATLVVPQTATDMSTYVGAATSNSDCVISGLAGKAQLGGFAAAFVQQKKPQKLISEDYGAPLVLEATGGKNSPLIGRMFIASAVPAPGNKAWTEFNSIVKKYAKNQKIVRNSGFAKNTYLAYSYFYELFKNLKKPSAAAVRARLNTIDRLPTVAGFPTPPGNWKEPFAVNGKPIANFQRLPGAAILFLTVKDGKIVDTDGKWHNVAGALVGESVK